MFLQSQVFQFVCQVADILVQHQQCGNVDYMGWSLSVPCSVETTSKLQELVSTMNEDLGRWKAQVSEAREKAYELNHYSNQQLLLLRRELHCTEGGVSFNLLLHLKSISPHVTEQEVQKTLQEVNSEPDSESEERSYGTGRGVVVPGR